MSTLPQGAEQIPHLSVLLPSTIPGLPSKFTPCPAFSIDRKLKGHGLLLSPGYSYLNCCRQETLLKKRII